MAYFASETNTTSTCTTSTSTANQLSFWFVSLLFLASVLLAFCSPAIAEIRQVEIGNGVVDSERVDGPRWTRVNFDPLITGTHTISLTWDNDAEITFSLVQLPSDNNGTPTVLATSNSTSPALWTGTLEISERYYLGVRAASGSANFIASIEADIPDTNGPLTVVSVQEGTLDSDKNAGPRWLRLNFDALASANHVVTLSWDSNADVRFRVFAAGGTAISPIIRGTNPGIWSGALDANGQYSISVWASSGIANFTATIEAAVSSSIAIESQPADFEVTEGDNASFTVVVAGAGTYTYQWYVDGNPISGETESTLTVFAAMLVEDGNQYSVEVSNGNETITSDLATLTVNEPLVLGLFSQEADTSAWRLEGPAPTLDYFAGTDTGSWGRSLLRIGDILLVGGDFVGIKPSINGPVTDRPWLAALNAVSGQPETTFQVPWQIDSVVRSLVLSPDGTQVYVGGDFGFLMLDAVTGEVQVDMIATDGNSFGRIFDIAVTNNHIYIGGDFNRLDDIYRANIARLTLNGDLDASWSPKVTHGYSAGRAAPVQSITVSTDTDTVYVGGNFGFIDGVAVDTTGTRGGKSSLLAVSADTGAVQPERFSLPSHGWPGAHVLDMAVTDDYVFIAWGGPNYLTIHSADGTRLEAINFNGDVQALQIAGNYLFVGHHGEYVYRNGAIVPAGASFNEPRKLYSFRIDDPTFPFEQSWPITGAFGVWGIAVSEDSVWIAGQLTTTGSNGTRADGLVRFPAL